MEAQILEKFSHIGFLDYNQVIKDLEKFDSISSKLDYLKKLKEQYVDEYEKVGKTLTKEEDRYRAGKSFIHESIFGDNPLYTNISIQKPVFDFYFEKEIENPELTYWFLKYNAQVVFNHTLKTFEPKLKSNLKETFIKSELRQIIEFEKKAEELLFNRELDIYNKHQNNYRYSKEVVLLRILDGNYYKENSISSFNSRGTDEVQLFAKHIFWKKFLIDIKQGINLKYSKQILKNIQTSINLFTYEFEEKKTEIIVPEDQTHVYLLKEFNINKKIKDYYFRPSIRLQNSESIAYLDKKMKYGWEYNLMPYSYIFFNAYHKRNNLFYSLLSISSDLKHSHKINNKTIETLFDLKPYFKEYSKGFKYGYDNFELEKVKKYLNEFSTKEDYVNKVFEFITIHNFNRGWLSSHGFTTNGLDSQNIINGFENGQIEGYYYKAWSLVFSSSDLYKSLFKNYFWNSKKVEICHKLIGRTNGENTPKTPQPVFHHIKDILKEYDLKPKKAKEMLNDIKGFVSKDWNTNVIPFIIDYLESIKKWKPQHLQTKTRKESVNKENLIIQENKLTPKTIEEVYNHFEILTRSKNKDDQYYLNTQQLCLFIKSTFIDLKPVKQTFNCIIHSKIDIRSVFYRFYKIASLLEKKQGNNIQFKYFSILNNSFEGFNDADKRNFRKTNNAILN